MSYSSVYFHRRKSVIHYWEYENGEKVHRSAPAPLYFYAGSDDGEYKTIFGGNAKKIECDKFGDFREKIKSYKGMGMDVFESDVPVETKFIVDNYLGKELTMPDFNIHYLDIEVHSEEGFPDPEEAKHPITVIAVWSTKDDKFFVFAEKDFDEKVIEEEYGEKVDKIIFDSEEELLKTYINFTYKDHPDILTGWNSSGFDIPYIINRAKNILGEKWAKRLSPIGVIKEREVHITEDRTETRYEIAGINCLDMLEVYKNYTFQDRENYKLGYIAQLEVGQTKVEYEGSIGDLYRDWQKYVEYNIQDTRLLRRLEEELGYLKMLITFCYGCRVPFEHYNRTTRVLDGAFISELATEGVVLPDVNRELKDTKYPGGFVKDPVRGLHDWVVSFDATSLYPSIMMGWNISPETKVGVINSYPISQVHKGLMGLQYDDIKVQIRKQPVMGIDIFEGTVAEVLFRIQKRERDGKLKLVPEVNENGGVHGLFNDWYVDEIKNCMLGKEWEEREFEFCGEIYSVEEFCDLLKEKNWCLAANGVVYSQDIQGVIPRFVENWFNKRKEYKKKMISADKEAGKAKGKEKDHWKREKQKYNLLQSNYKLLINSVYGFLGTVYSRLYDYDNCVAVCINGQNITKTAVRTLNGYYKKKYGIDDFVIYGDTDSVYLRTSDVFQTKNYPNIDTTNMEKMRELISDYISTEGENGYTKNKLGKPCFEHECNHVISKAMENLTQRTLNCSTNKIFFKREAIARKAIFLERKRYVAWVLNDEGVDVDKLKSTGVELVRSSTPLIVQGYLKEIIFDILKQTSEKSTKEILGKCRESFMIAKPEEIAKPSGCNTYLKYVDRMEEGDFKSIPPQVKSAFLYNNIIKGDRKLIQNYEEIFEGEKMKWLYMKTDSTWRHEAMGFKDKWVKELDIDHLIDREQQFEKVFIGAIEPFYAVLGWGVPNFKNADVDDLFGF